MAGENLCLARQKLCEKMKKRESTKKRRQKDKDRKEKEKKEEEEKLLESLRTSDCVAQVGRRILFGRLN